MWLSEEVLLSKSTWERRCSVNSNGNPFCNVRGLHVSVATNRDNPFSSHSIMLRPEVMIEVSVFQRQQLKPLSEFIHMCDSLEKFVLGDDELSSEIFDRLQKYTGV
jgi:hypothetical protein